jgi:hypothetical protein
MESHMIHVVPVVNKTNAIFTRSETDHTQVLDELKPELKQLLDAGEEYTVTEKTDGTCGMVLRMPNGKPMVLRRQDIKKTNRNYVNVKTNGEIQTIGSKPCWVTTIVRGEGKSAKTVNFYIFQLSSDLVPEEEADHLVGFTPLDHTISEDKHAITCICTDGLNGESGMKILVTEFTGSLDIPVKKINAEEFMAGSDLITVEIMGSKISKRYDYGSDLHFLNPHGSIVIPPELHPPFTNLSELKKWFESDSVNPWANTEGVVIHFPKSGLRFKVHRGHCGLEKTWQSKTESGIRFIHQ